MTHRIRVLIAATCIVLAGGLGYSGLPGPVVAHGATWLLGTQAQTSPAVQEILLIGLADLP